MLRTTDDESGEFKGAEDLRIGNTAMPVGRIGRAPVPTAYRHRDMPRDGDGDGKYTANRAAGDVAPLPIGVTGISVTDFVPEVDPDLAYGLRPGLQLPHARLVFDTQQARDDVGDLFNVIGALHGVDPFDGFSLVVVEYGRPRGYRAGFMGGIQTRTKAGRGLLSHIYIDPHPLGLPTREQRRFGLLHEFGHRLDMRFPEEGVFGPRGQRVVGWSECATPAMDRFMRAVEGLPFHPKREEIAGGMSDTDAQYFMSRKEIWARAYSQWVAMRSQREDLVEAMRYFQSPRFSPIHEGLYHFTDEEMALLRPHIEAVLRERGLY